MMGLEIGLFETGNGFERAYKINTIEKFIAFP